MKYRNYGVITGFRGYNGTVYIGAIPPGSILPSEGIKVKIGFSEQFSKEFTLKKWKTTKNGAIAKFLEINSDSEAILLKEKGVFIEEKYLTGQSEETFFVDKLIGCSVSDWKTGEVFGKIIDVWILPANDVWLVKTEKGELPVPVIDDVIKEVDIEGRTVKIDVIDGLFDLLESDSESKE